MIPVVEEPEDEWLRGIERCYFCKERTTTWHLRTNQPVCKCCARTHKVAEVPLCVPGFKYKPETKK